MTTWTKKPFSYKLVGLESGSAKKPYEIVVTTDLRDGQQWISCNCMSWTRGKQNRGVTHPSERSCKHTQRGYTINSPEIDFDGPLPVHIPPEVKDPTGRIAFVKPMLPARWDDRYEEDVFYGPDWTGTVKVDGHRCLIVKQPYGNIEAFSRGGKRMMGVEKSFRDLPLSTGTMLDTEVVVDDITACHCEERVGQRKAFESVAHFRSDHSEALGLIVLDVLYIGGVSVMKADCQLREQKARAIVKKLDSDRVKMVEIKPRNKLTKEWLEELAARGEEGAVFKKDLSVYEPGVRSAGSWLKWKPELETHDVVILRTLPPSEKMDPTHLRLAYGWADGEEKGVAPLSGPAEEMEALVGQVMECAANAVLPSGALLYPRFVRMREKQPEECERP